MDAFENPQTNDVSFGQTDVGAPRQVQVAIALLSKLPGARIIDCRALSKLPLRKGWVDNATNDPAEIEKLFHNASASDPAGAATSNVGLVLGFEVIVIDVEGPKKKNEKSRQGIANLAVLECELGPLPSTVVVHTPSGGEHRYYKVTKELGLTPAAKFLGADGVELRTGSQFVVIPPSSVVDSDGSILEYKFAPNCHPSETDVAELPETWIKAAKAADEAQFFSVNHVARLEETQAREWNTANKPDFKLIYRGCSFIQHCVDRQAELPEPYWKAEADITAHCTDGARLFHENSRNYPGYSFAETENKIAQAQKVKPRTCNNIRNKLGFEGCARCPFYGSINSPISLGYRTPEMITIQSNTVYVGQTMQYLDLASMRLWGHQEFASYIRHKVKGNPHSKLTASASMPRVERTDYLPGETSLIVAHNGSPAVNIWQPGGIKPKGGDATILLELFEFLIPDAAARDHVLDYFAHLLVHRGVKISHGLIIIGPQGVGKTTIRKVISPLFGDANTRRIDGATLSQKWTAPFVNTEVLFVEEVAHGQKHEIYNSTKELVTDETFWVEEKNVRRWEGRSPRGIVLFSNHANPLSLAEDDRRWHVTATTDERKEPDYYAGIYRAINDDGVIAALASVLSERNLSRFSADAPPPTTDAKQRAIGDSRTPIAQALRDLIEGDTFSSDLSTIDSLQHALRLYPELGTPTSTRVASALREIGGDGPWETRTHGQKKVKLWAVRNVPKWRRATPAERRQEYLRLPSAAAAVLPFERVPSDGNLQGGGAKKS